MVEKELRNLLRKQWSGWIDWLEPHGAAGLGRPDCDLLVDRSLAPVELKISCSPPLPDSNWFRLRTMRPSQISWHQRFIANGGCSFFLICDFNNQLWACHRIVEIQTNKELFLFQKKVELNRSQIESGLTSFIRGCRNGR